MTGKTWTIGQVARRFSLARSTLLYYDSVGLLTPSGRTGSNYRLYKKADLDKLERIRHYREAGLSLQAIACVLHRDGDGLRSLLEDRFVAIDLEIQRLVDQQALIRRLLRTEAASPGSEVVTKAMWVSLLRDAGLDEPGMQVWHRDFERVAPDAHEEFLASLGIGPEEIARIRGWSQGADPISTSGPSL